MVDVVQEEEGVLKSGLVYGGLSPLKSKKSFYCVLRERVIELHESEKSQKKNKTPKLIIDLAICFNVNRKVDTKLKECVSIMMPDECYVLRGETDEQTEDWYDAFISAAIPARALHLGRPVSRDEFFECAWEVTLMKYPKLKKAPPRADLEDLCAKNPKLLGDKRLCFYPHAVVICERGIEPATTGIPTSCIPPFKKEDFIEVQLMYVANFGKQEKYFFMRMGRSAPTGSGEIWAMAESGEVATDMHNKLNKIVERESEKKRQLGVGPLVHPRTTSSSRHPGSSGSSHRERSNTQPQRQRTPSIDNM
uniref:Insulin receptor substrate 1 n=1 Tax=Plectus sambesii TaxID=2011161 RepID=A0A914VYV2_9BILA